MSVIKVEKGSCGGCLLRGFIGAVVCVLILGAIAGGVALHAKKFVQNVGESAPATYSPLLISDGEKEDIDHVMSVLHEGRNHVGLIDESITPAVFNGIVERISAGEKERGREVELLALRLDTEGDHFKVAATKLEKGKPANQAYINVDAAFDLEIVEGKLTKAELKRATVGEEPLPLALRVIVNHFIGKIRDGTDPKAAEDLKGIRFVKLLKREGNRIHVILDPSLFDQGGQDAPKAAAKGPGKDEF